MSGPAATSERAGPARERRAGWTWPLIWAGLGLASYGISLALTSMPESAEALLGGGRGSLPPRLLSRLTGSLPFSLGEILLAGYAVWLVALSVGALRQLAGGSRTLRDALTGGVRRALRDGGIVATAFYLLWGFNYALPGLEARLGWGAWEGVEAERLVELTEQAVRTANAEYLSLHGVADAGHPTRVLDQPGLDGAVADGWARASGLLPPPAPPAGPTGSVKRPVVSGIMARLGISGVYFPFTAEPHVLRDLPAVSAVQAMAHETAHLRGFANEAEASFVGFLANSLTDHPLARYSAAVFAARQLLSALARVDPEERARIAGLLEPGIRRDLEDLQAFWAPYRGVGQRIGTAVNDRYLRANRVPGGVTSYARSARLLIQFADATGGLFPERRTP